ncbi:5'-nucleotidase C-terminal domain-containing protein [Ostreibacterium oceani]|uniref:5'-nucleotidase C-terminal domain-containing protein n=1 Tax=Ostreibacterium oceani TaxID=2654998 RepID=UPI001C408B26|nr:5'-nucleotidase C-terminal domain-containing protein [Ostreibacterium oceani]
MKKLLPIILLGCVSWQASADFTLNISHINDHHSHLNPEDIDLMLPSGEVEVELGGFPRVTAQINAQAARSEHHVKIHAGDAITGDLFYTLFKGEADAALMNTVCFDVFTVGNHEFDAGDAGLKTFLDYLLDGSCDTTVLGSNVSPEVGVSPLAPNAVDDYLKRTAIKSFGDQQVGFIGIDIANKTKQSSSPDETTVFADELETAQTYINELVAMGINQIVLVTHYQYQNDIALAAQLSHVDAIIGGDSHSLLGEQFAEVGLNPQGAYPTRVTNADGDLVCIVQAWQYAAVVGELALNFDDAGALTSCEGTPHLLLGDTFVRDDETLTGDALATVQAELAAISGLTMVTPDANAEMVLADYAAQAEELETTVIGNIAENLCLERIPGQGRSSLCDVSETAERGSDITMVVAEAFREMSVLSDVTIQNAGGVRIDIPAGELTIGDAYRLLPFANTIVNLDMTGAEIKQTLEEAIDVALYVDGGSSGAYPYAAGLRFDVAAGRAFGERIQNLEVKVKGSDSWASIDPSEFYLVATNSFIASGGDGYDTMKRVFNDPLRAEDTFLDYAQAFVDYVEARGTVGKLPTEDYSTRRYCATYDCGGISDLWWDEDKGGYGVSIKRLDNRVVVRIYGYDAEGQPYWSTLEGIPVTDESDAGFTAGGDVYTYRYDGQAIGGQWSRDNVTPTIIGSGSLVYDKSADTVALSVRTSEGDYDLDLTRFNGNDRQAGDGVYWAPDKSGQGLYVSNRASRVFVQWFVYDENGQSAWYTIEPSADDENQYVVYSPSYSGGNPMQAFDPANVVRKAVGTASLTQNNGRSYTLSVTLTAGPNAGQMEVFNLTAFDY